MNLSMKWLADYVDVNVPIKDYCHALTMSGSKVEGYEVEGEKISKVVVGKILSKGPHENADALFVCQVEVGAEAPIQIVTNAKNVKEGDIVPVALDGAVLPEGKIKKGKLRGVESFGMFCGLDTLGLTINDFPYADPDGVLVIEEECEIGQDIHDALGLDDTSVEFEITSNRPDCLSVIGLARETAATFNLPLTVKEPEFKGVDGDINEMLKVDIHNTEKCQRYCAGIVKNVKIGSSPRWMRERLRASGVRPINNFVDITNYVMLEYGQPMHAFDLRYVEGAHINVRNAVNGEKIMTLDGVERELTEDMLVIADEKKPVAVAGVMGGEYSGIMEDTTKENVIGMEQPFVFGLDIGTRNVVGMVGHKTDENSFVVDAAHMIPHETRAMLDGQIHDIQKVGDTIRAVKEHLESVTGRKLEEVCIAAAGRVLRTVTTHVEYPFVGDREVEQEDIYALVSAGVENAYQEFLDNYQLFRKS